MPTLTSPHLQLADAQHGSPVRRTAFRALAVLLGAVLTLLTAHLLVTGWFDGTDGGARRFDDIAWGSIEGVVVAAGLLAQWRRPERHASGLRQSVLGLLALVIGGALTGAFDQATTVVLLLVLAACALHPARAQVVRAPRRPDRVLLALALGYAVPLLVWAGVVVHRAGSLPATDVHVTHQDPAGLAGLAIGLALVTLLAAFDRTSRLPSSCAGVALALVGVASLVTTGQADALPAAAAAAALAGGVVLPVVAELRRRSPLV